ncbi:MAG: hypothetical protein JO363_05750 [Solirubrobacterales bacterium]|nr:hypothetical protein [Solirubrobacterales bacterium]
MALCCPPGHGCNAPGGAEPCALTLCRAAAKEEDDAALALARWGDFEAVGSSKCGDGERRFRRRAFERARDRALITLAMAQGTRGAPGAPGASPMKKAPRRSQPRQGRRLAARGAYRSSSS